MTVPCFAAGAPVRVKALYPPGHVRTPFYTRGRTGRVIGLAAVDPDPQALAYGRRSGQRVPVYRVRFAASELWPEAGQDDAVVVDLVEHWLEPVS